MDNNLNIGVDAARLAGLQIDLLQKIRNGHVTSEHLEWFNNLSKKKRDELLFSTNFDKYFTFMKEFTFIAPSGCDSKSYLSDFKEKHRKEFVEFSDDITDVNFSKVTNVLIPGKEYLVKLIRYNGAVQLEDCIKAYEYHKALFVGAQGIATVFEVAKDELLKGKAYLSFDKKDNLWKNSDGVFRIPGLGCYDKGGFDFSNFYFKFAQGDYFALLVVCDCPL